MRTLVVVGNPVKKERIRRTLQAQGHQVVMATPKDLGEALLPAPELAIVEVSKAHDLVSEVRAANARVPIIALGTRDASLVTRALESGATDFLWGDWPPEILMARIGIALTLAAGGGGAEADPLEGLIAWNDAPRLLSQEIGAMFGLFLQDSEATGSVPDRGAQLTVTSAEAGLSLMITVAMTVDGLEGLGNLVFGELQSDEVMADCLREIANCLGGGFKRLAMAEGSSFTLGLPRDCDGMDVLTADKSWVASADGVEFIVGIQRAGSDAVKVRASALTAGMVLKRDVQTASGVLLVGAGMALTETTIDRLVKMFGPTTAFEVMQGGT